MADKADIVKQGEQWLPIKGYEEYYEISDCGRVRTIKRLCACSAALGGKGVRTVPAKIRKPNILKGYHCITLIVNGKSKGFKIHRLVAEHFLSAQPTSEHQINHIDGNKANNHVSNLEWVLPVENTRHAIETGLRRNPTVETKAKMGAASKRAWQDENYRAEQSRRMRERWQNEELREATLRNMRGKIRTEEQRKHYAAVIKETQPVVNLTTGEVFKSRKEAAQKYNRTPEAISAAIHGKCRTCARCEWRYA